jgi:ABC-type microcin C transport system duplicated ATPase subunit YejF
MECLERIRVGVFKENVRTCRKIPPPLLTRRAIDDILTDMKKTAPMNRLIQGDVGSGKTAVAAAALAFTAAFGTARASGQERRGSPGAR